VRDWLLSSLHAFNVLVMGHSLTMFRPFKESHFRMEIGLTMLRAFKESYFRMEIGLTMLRAFKESYFQNGNRFNDAQSV